MMGAWGDAGHLAPGGPPGPPLHGAHDHVARDQVTAAGAPAARAGVPKLRLGIVGCGAVAAIHHLPAALGNPEVEVAVLVDRDCARAEELARKAGGAAVATLIDEAYQSIDAAIVTVPNAVHAPVACALLERGVHVLVEKPMATSAAECDAMIAAAAAAERVLAVGLEFRFFSATALVRDQLARELLGSLRGFDLRLGVVSRWPFASDHFLKPGGGVLADYGSHLLDLLIAWLGDLTVEGYRDDQLGGAESDCEIDLITAGGVHGRAELSRTRNLRNSVIFECDRGALEVGLWDPDPAISLRLGGSLDLEGRARGAGVAADDFASVFARQLDDFVRACRGGEPLVPASEGRRSVALIERCGALRQPLELPWLALPVRGGGR